MELKVMNESDDRVDMVFNGRLDAPGVDEIGTRFFGYLNDLKKNVFIDFTDVSYLSSLGIRLLLNGMQMLTRDGYSLQITHAIPDVKKVLQDTGLEELLG
ncbi:MAG: STAS domain-containing protein [Bacteroidales bacterium]